MKTRSLQRDKWFALIEEQEKSGLSVSDFCKEHNLKLSHMHSYRHLLKKHKEIVEGNVQGKLVPIKIKPKHKVAIMLGEIRLILNNGIQCVLPSNTELNQIKALVEVLMIC